MINSTSFLAKVQSDTNTGMFNDFQESLSVIDCPDQLQNREILSKLDSWPQKHKPALKESKPATDLSVH